MCRIIDALHFTKLSHLKASAYRVLKVVIDRTMGGFEIDRNFMHQLFLTTDSELE